MTVRQILIIIMLSTCSGQAVNAQRSEAEKQIIVDKASDAVGNLLYAIICEDNGLLPKFELSQDAVNLLNALDRLLESINIKPSSIRDHLIASNGTIEFRQALELASGKSREKVTSEEIAQLKSFALTQCDFRLRSLENQAKVFAMTGNIIGN